MKKLEFTEEQKKQYRRLKMIVASVGISGIAVSAALYIVGYRSSSEIILDLVCFFLIIYVYGRYRKILLKGKLTVAYAELQKEIYAKVLKGFGIFLIPYSLLIACLLIFQIELLAENPVLLALLIFVPGIAFGVWALKYEKKKLGAVMRAP